MIVIEQPELGLKKELREMLPIIVYKESFSVKDTLWVKLPLGSPFCFQVKFGFAFFKFLWLLKSIISLALTLQVQGVMS